MDMRVARGEHFGPVLSVLKWKAREAGIAMTHASEYGLASAVWTHGPRAAMMFTR